MGINGMPQVAGGSQACCMNINESSSQVLWKLKTVEAEEQVMHGVRTLHIVIHKHSIII
jgi:hypothetical protein